MKAWFFQNRPVSVSIRSRFDQSKNLILLLKNVPDHHYYCSNTESKIESRRCRFCWYLSYILAIRLRDCSISRSFDVNDSSFNQAAVRSPWRDFTILKTLRHEVITSCAKRQLPRASSLTIFWGLWHLLVMLIWLYYVSLLYFTCERLYIKQYNYIGFWLLLVMLTFHFYIWYVGINS